MCVHHFADLSDTDIVLPQLQTYDLRYSQRDTPLMQFDGYMNTYTVRFMRRRVRTSLGRRFGVLTVGCVWILQGVAVDPVQDLLFAAGQDWRERLWSLPECIVGVVERQGPGRSKRRTPAAEEVPANRNDEGHYLAADMPEQ